MAKSYGEINERIRRGEVVVMTAEEVTAMAQHAEPEEIAERVDVVTTGTFAPMCSSGAFLNLGHTSPPMRMEEITLNGVPAHAGVAAVDCYLGATAVAAPGDRYGGAHVIEDLVRGQSVHLEARGRGTDCYPRTHLRTLISPDTINEMILFNPRNAYQNYAAAVNSSHRTLYTYMGTLLPGMANLTYSTSGELSPLLNCPGMETVGIGTRIFLGGAAGYVSFSGTQFDNTAAVNHRRIPVRAARTLAVTGDMRAMNPRWLRGACYPGYGVSLFVGLGIPIPILDPEIARAVSVTNAEIHTVVVDFGVRGRPTVATVTHEQLRGGTVWIEGKEVKTSPLSSLSRAREIAEVLKAWITRGNFHLGEPVDPLPGEGTIGGLRAGIEPREPTGGAPDVRQGPLLWTPSRCVGCGACTAPCPTGARSLPPESDDPRFDPERCSGCMECSAVCPVDALAEAGGQDG